MNGETVVHNDRNDSTPNVLVVEPSRVQDRVGERHRMSKDRSAKKEKGSSMSSNTQTAPDSPSTSADGPGTQPPLFEEDGKHDSSSTLREKVAAWSSEKRSTPDPELGREWTEEERAERREHALKLIEGGVSQERRREFTVTLHCSTFGKESHVVDAARNIVAEAILRSGFVLQANLNGEELHGDYDNSESWRKKDHGVG